MSQLQEIAPQSVEQSAVFSGFKHLNLNVPSLIQLPEAAQALPEREISKLLTEVDHLVGALDTHGNVPEVVRGDVTTNIETALAEISMPYAVTRTAHRVEKSWDAEQQRTIRTFEWLGRCAVGVAKSGYDFHVSEAAIKRVDVEVAEAAHTQETLQTGTVQFFLSPRMSREDAPAHVAKDEHLHDEDSIRASYLVVDREGNETFRVMESLLVTDVPLEAWVALLKDENNLFGKSIEVTDETSALAVMETFTELELPAEAASEGPVTLVAAVIPYIEDETLRLSAMLQLEKFRSDQELYRLEAKRFAVEWYDFELELAKSLRTGTSTPRITQFINNIESLWSQDIRDTIEDHSVNGGYVMTRELAAMAEKAKRNIIATKAAVKTGNEKVIDQVDAQTVEAIQSSVQGGVVDYVRDDMIARELDRSIVQQNVEVSGGCAGGACGLEGVASNSREESELRKELGAEPGDVITKDKVRACRCGNKNIVYAHNSTKVIKKCLSCGALEKKFTKPA
jgi:hypothetical protein